MKPVFSPVVPREVSVLVPVVRPVWDSADRIGSGDRLESYDAHKYRLSQAEELLRSVGYREVPTADGTVWEKAEDDAVESARGEGGPEERFFVGHVHVEIRADADGAHVMSFSWDWNEALLAQSTAAQILRHEMSDKWTLYFGETLTTAGFAGFYRIYFYVTNTADGRRVDILSAASGCEVMAESGILPEPTRGTT